MSETTTTVADSDASAESPDSQVEEQDPKTAAEGSATEETHTDPKSGSESDAGKPAELTDETKDWLKNKGIDPSDPDAVHKAAEKWRAAEQEFHQSRQKSRESIHRAVAKDEEVQQLDEAAGQDTRLVNLERQVSEYRFFSEHPEITSDKREDTKREIIAVAKEFKRLAADFDLEALYAIAKSRRAPEAEAAAEARGRKAKAEEIERRSGSAIPDGNAKGGEQPKADSFLAGFNRK